MLTFERYPFLAELGLKPENHGASLNNAWHGDGAWATSLNPNTGETVAKIKLATLQQYEAGMQEMLKVKRMWADVCMHHISSYQSHNVETLSGKLEMSLEKRRKH